MPVEDDPHRRPAAEPRQTAGQLRVVGEDGPGTDHDRVVDSAQPMPPLARRRPGDPLAFAAAGGNPTVERGCELQGDERPAEGETGKEAGIDLGRLLGAEPGIDREPRRKQPGDPVAGDARIGVFERDDYPSHPGIDQCVGTRRSLTPMAAGFEAHIGGSAARRAAGPAQRFGFGMRPAAGLGPAAADDPALADDDATDRRVRPDRAESPPGQRQRQRHPATVIASIGIRA